MSITIIDTEVNITYNPNIICGICNQYAKLHAVDEIEQETLRNNAEPFQFIPQLKCSRFKYEVGDLYGLRYSDNDELDSLQGMPLPEFSGPSPFSEVDPWLTEPELLDGSDGAYNDLDPREQTVTLAEYQSGKRPLSSIQPQRNAFVEGTTGFLIQEVYNPVLTERYAMKLLNAYKDVITHKQRVGSMEITHNTDQTISAECVKCHALVTVHLNHEDLTRELMQQFVYFIISHGNNHAARWFTQRPEFYKLHAPHCDLTCDPHKPSCPVPTTISEADILKLKNHFANAS